ncbi:hypothetical protein CJU90_6356 [Yarrowia sp. C11]|nr:hypothetical protein CJU90_6356 [Yarrowia sp. C11]KAG5371057.1 hypothetical protein CKK34_1197 [Yarrowia sp. E02]
MNDTRLLCTDGDVHTSSRTINEKWQWVSFRLQSTYNGFYAQVDYPKTWVHGFLSWIYRSVVPAYDTLDVYTGMLMMAAESMKHDLFTRLEDILVGWNIKSGSEAILIWERASKASSARVQNYIVNYVKADPLLVFSDSGFYSLPSEMRSLLCQRVSDGRKIKTKRSVYLKSEDSDDEGTESLEGLTLDGLTTTPVGSHRGASTMSVIRTPKSNIDGCGTTKAGAGASPKVSHKKNRSVPTNPTPALVNTGSWNLPFTSYNANCKIVPEEIVRKIREELKIRDEVAEAAKARMKAFEEARARAREQD